MESYMPQPTIDEIVAKLGEPTRPLVTHAINWLEKEEPTWGCDEPTDRWEFIEELLLKQA
jgi:hypothetical protein